MPWATSLASPRTAQNEDVTLFVGPDRAVNVIEVGVVDTNDGPLIIHAMPARTRRFPPRKD